MSHPLSKTHNKKSLHLRGACHRSCGVQRGGSNLQAQSGVRAGAALVTVEPGNAVPPKHVGLEDDFPFPRSDGFKANPKTHTFRGKIYPLKLKVGTSG